MRIVLNFTEADEIDEIKNNLDENWYDISIRYDIDTYTGDSLATKTTPSSYVYVDTIDETLRWYIGNHCRQYTAVVIQIDDREPSKPIISDKLSHFHSYEGIPEAIEAFDNKIIQYLTESLGTDYYIDLDDIIM